MHWVRPRGWRFIRRRARSEESRLDAIRLELSICVACMSVITDLPVYHFCLYNICCHDYDSFLAQVASRGTGNGVLK